MSIIGNIIWFLFGGILAGIIWYLVGLLWCLTIIGIPVGLQCFKLGRLSFFPFGKDVVLSGETTSLLLNIFLADFRWYRAGNYACCFCCDFVLHDYRHSLRYAAF